MKILNKSFLFLFLICFLNTFAQKDVLLRYPDLDPKGDRITFSCFGDIWMCHIDGSNLQRLTVHQAYEKHPRFSQDGTKIAFVSNRFGNDDIFEIDLSTLQIERKTYYDSPDELPSYDKDGNICFITRRAYVNLEREFEAYGFETGKSTPNRILDATTMAIEPSYSGASYAFVTGICRTTREAYEGPAQRDIWLFDKEGNNYDQITFSKGQDVSVRWTEKDIYKLGAVNGVYHILKRPISQSNQLFSVVLESDKPGIRYFDVNKNGSVLTYERLDGVYIVTQDSTYQLTPQFPLDNGFYKNEFKTISKGVSSFSLSPNEKMIALEANGEIFITQNQKDHFRTKNVSEHAFKDEKPQWLNDSTLLFISDRDGMESIFKVTSNDDINDLLWSYDLKVEPVISKDNIITDFKISPKGDKICVISEPGTLEIAPIDTLGEIGPFKKIYESWALPRQIEWSPDSRWISYTANDLNFNAEVFIMNVENQRSYNVSMHPRRDHSAKWSPDGSKLAFVSQRNNSDNDIWYVWLREEDYLHSKSELENQKQIPETFRKKIGLRKDTSTEKTVQIDTTDIYRRLVQLTSYSGDEGNIQFDSKGKYIYYTKSNGKERELFKIKWNGKENKKLLNAKGLSSPKIVGKHLYYVQKGILFALSAGSKKGEVRPFAGKMQIHNRAIQEQVFKEAWRQIKTNFYDPDFHGQDFDALRKLYEPICLKATTKQDFRYIFNEMLGQINASHMGLYGSNPEKTQKQKSGKLGAEFKAVEGGLRIERIIPEGPLDKPESSLRKGDLISHINGTPITSNINAYKLLLFENGERPKIEASTKEGQKIIFPKTVNSERNLLYKEWVNSRRKLTQQYSNGKLGYIHIRGMNWGSFEEFERELMASGYGKEGIIIDVRYNGGGWTTDMLLTVLNVQQHAYTIPRGATSDLSKHKNFKSYYPYGERLPLSWWTKPAAALCNSSSYSNAEIFSHAFKNLDRGPLVGEPTFGAVISTGGKRLMDGSLIRLPFRGWFVKKSGKNMDFHAAVPDHIVPLNPGQKNMNSDPQLKKAVEVLLK